VAGAGRRAKAGASRAKPRPTRRKAAKRSTGEAAELRAALAEQERTVRRLGFLVEASKVLNSTLDLGELIKIILGIATEHTSSERATLFLVDEKRNELWSLLAQGLDQKEIRLPAGQGLAGWVAQTGEVVNIDDAYADSRFDSSVDRQFGYTTRNLLVMPVRDRDARVVGVLEVLNRREGSFTPDDIGFLDSLSVHAAIALENARLHRESLERQRLSRDLALARTIQQGLLPEAPPLIEGFDVGVRHETSYLVGGDYYDFIQLDRSTHLFVVADVEGKGASSALVMSNLQATLKTLVRHVHAIEGVLYHLNESILRGTRGGKYMTLFLGLLDGERKGLHYINAGHVTPVVVRPGGSIHLQEGGIVVGLLPEARYRRGFLPLRQGDVILACTDGITEAATESDEQYGYDRMVQKALEMRDLPARGIVEAIFADVLEFSQEGTHEDDKVMMAIKVL
jgi:sigma-B regulation protein RsbU (phosphoserine phosphatase)